VAEELVSRGLIDPWQVDDLIKNEVIPRQEALERDIRSIQESVGAAPNPNPNPNPGPGPGPGPDLPVEGLPVEQIETPVWIRPFDLSANIASGSQSNPTTTNATEEAPESGWVKTVTISWQAGTSNLVGASLWGPSNAIVPDQLDGSDYIYREDTERTFEVWQPLEGGENMEAKYENQDGQGHFIGVEVKFVPYRADIAALLPDARIPADKRGDR
jgi:hypothetical protein